MNLRKKEKKETKNIGNKNENLNVSLDFTILKVTEKYLKEIQKKNIPNKFKSITSDFIRVSESKKSSSKTDKTNIDKEFIDISRTSSRTLSNKVEKDENYLKLMILKEEEIFLGKSYLKSAQVVSERLPGGISTPNLEKRIKSEAIGDTGFVSGFLLDLETKDANEIKNSIVEKVENNKSSKSHSSLLT